MKKSKKNDRDRDINRSMTAGPETGVQAAMPDCFHIGVGFSKMRQPEIALQMLGSLNLRARRIMAIKPKGQET